MLEGMGKGMTYRWFLVFSGNANKIIYTIGPRLAEHLCATSM